MNPKFNLGTVLVVSVRLWARNLLPFLVLTVLVYAPLAIWGIAADQDPEVRGLVRFDTYALFLAWPLSVPLSAALTYGVVMDLKGQRASLGACLMMWLRRFFPSLGTLLLLALCFAGVFVVLGLPLGGIAGLIHNKLAGAVLGWIILAGMLWLYGMMAVALPVCVIERPGAAAALGRSRDLTRGHKVAIAGLMLLVLALGLGLHVLITALTIPDHVTVYVYLTVARYMVMGSLGATLGGVTYYYLRAEKEGTAADELAAVFA